MIAFASPPPEPPQCPCIHEKSEGRLDLLDWERKLNVLTCGLYRRWWLSVVRRVDASNYKFSQLQERLRKANALEEELRSELAVVNKNLEMALATITTDRLISHTKTLEIQYLKDELDEQKQRLSERWKVIGCGRLVASTDIDRVVKSLEHALKDVLSGNIQVLVTYDFAKKDSPEGRCK